ncbi:MAG: FeoA domain-containing protein [Verrucomicrobia bacterium]|nr:FeoA domain-containing protein [Verrucomicrobiota bacterium]
MSERILSLIALTAGTVAVILLLRLLARAWRHHRELIVREEIEDALKHIRAMQVLGTRATAESLAGHMSIRMGRALQIIRRMTDQGLIETRGIGLRLTAEGMHLALRVLRAHRLLERYLVDEVGVPLEKVHKRADRKEHLLSEADADRLEVELGYPATDPHGDPIPSASGAMPELHRVALCDWETMKPGRIVHIEDEPPAVYSQIVALDLKPGMTLEILEAVPERIVVSTGTDEFVLSPLVAGNIHVVAAPSLPLERVATLAELRIGQKAFVKGLAEDCAGLTRRRFLDLGITPGTRIEAAMESAFDGLSAFQIRGSLIALRRNQLKNVLIEGVESAV